MPFKGTLERASGFVCNAPDRGASYLGLRLRATNDYATRKKVGGRKETQCLSRN